MSVPVGSLINLQNGTVADATQVMTNFNALVAAFGGAAAAGANNDITSLNGITTPLTPASGGSTVYTASSSSAGTNTISISGTVPLNFTQSNGNAIVFRAGGTNTGATTLNVNGLGNTPVQRRTATGLAPLVGGEIVAGQIIVAVYDNASSSFQLTSSAPSAPSYFVATATAGGTANALTIANTFPSDFSLTISPLPTLVFKASNTNTGPATLQVGATAAFAIVRRVTNGTVPFTGGEIVAGSIYAVAWDGTQYQLMSPTIPNLATRQTLTASGTYTTPAGVKQLFVRMCGGGGGGGGSTNTGAGVAGGNGGTTSFNSGAVTAIGGTGGAQSGGTPGAGGTGGTGGVFPTRLAGGSGQRGAQLSTTGFTIQIAGGRGGTNSFGGQGNDVQVPAPNTGCGGDGCFLANTTSAGAAGSGGGAGEYVEFVLNAPLAASYVYAIGAAGTGAVAAAAGAAGIIIVEERYQP